MATDFRDLRVWEEAMVLAEKVYQLSRQLPADERFGLAAQLKARPCLFPPALPKGMSTDPLAPICASFPWRWDPWLR